MSDESESSLRFDLQVSDSAENEKQMRRLKRSGFSGSISEPFLFILHIKSGFLVRVEALPHVGEDLFTEAHPAGAEVKFRLRGKLELRQVSVGWFDVERRLKPQR